MKNLIFITLFLTSFYSEAQEITGDSLIAGFQSGKLFIVNELAIASADSSFFNKLSTLELSEYELLEPKEGKKNYGTLGATGVIRITAENTKSLSEETIQLLDASILKYFNKEDSTFYYSNGYPNTNIYYALDPLLNKKIEEVREMGSNEAMAIWGSAGKRGAIIVNCKDEKLKIYE